MREYFDGLNDPRAPTWFPGLFAGNRLTSFCIGGKSSSSTASSSTTTSTAYNQQVGAAEGAIAVGAGSSAQINIENLDAELAQRALSEVGDIASDANYAVTQSALASSAASSDSAYSSSQSAQAAITGVTEVARDSLQTTENVTGKAFDFGYDAITGLQDVAKESLYTGQQTTQNALAFGTDALAEYGSVVGKSYDFSKDVNYEAQSTLRDVLDKAFAFTEDAQSDTNRLISQTNEMFTSSLARNAGDAPQTIFQDSMKTLLYGGGILASLVGLYFVFGQKKA